MVPLDASTVVKQPVVLVETEIPLETVKFPDTANVPSTVNPACIIDVPTVVQLFQIILFCSVVFAVQIKLLI